MVQQHKTIPLVQLSVIWLLVEITVMPTYTLKQLAPTMMVAVALTICTVLHLVKVL